MLDSLPVELLELLLSDECITAADMASVAVTCIRLHSVVTNSNKLWRNKFKQRFCELQLLIGVTTEPWRDWYKRVEECSRRVHVEVARMLSLYYRNEHVPKEAFAAFEQLTYDYPRGYDLVVRELRNIMTEGRPHDNLTVKYYAEKTLSYIRHVHLRSIWQEFVKLVPSDQSIEKGTILIAQWFQPTDDLEEYRDFRMPLDIAARLAMARLSVIHPDHPLVQRQQLVDDELLAESLWSPYHCTQILQCVNYTLYEEIGFHREQNEQESYAPNSSYLNIVLKRITGIPILLAVVYMSVARRLGVVCEPVALPTHFFLRYCEHPNHPDPPYRYTYVDAYHGGRMWKRNEMRCPYASAVAPVSQSDHVAATPLAVLERMTRNLIEGGRRQGSSDTGMQCLRHGLELLAVLRPDDVESTLLLARVYLHLVINLKEVLASLQEVLTRDPSQTGIVAHMYRTCKSLLNDAVRSEAGGSSTGPTTTVSLRPADGSVVFAVGMVMTHEEYNYSCVIFGWDSHCAASREWIVQMGVNQLSNKQYQPFYNVLVSDGSIRYAAQENLRVAIEPTFIEHPDVGKYFSSFDGTHFVPNEAKRCEYPEDDAIRIKFLKENILASVNPPVLID